MGPRFKARRALGLRLDDRNFQKESWFKPTDKRISNGIIVGKIFFPTGGHNLSSDDTAELDKLITHYSEKISEGYFVTLEFIGKADEQTYANDRRKFSDSNRRLSERRAKIVKQYVSRRMKNQNIGLIKIYDIGAGEQAGSNLAENRVVIIEERKRNFPAIKKISRIVERNFDTYITKVDPSERGSTGRWIGEVNFWHENKRRKEEQKNYEVNRFEITEIIDYEGPHGGDYTKERFYRWTWGPPNPFITVIDRRITKYQGVVSSDHKSEEKVDRDKAKPYYIDPEKLPRPRGP